MTRRHLTFALRGATLFGTLDLAPEATGLLIVSGGDEIRAGAWAGQAQLAANVATAGFPVFRFDRRGVGDSAGDNRGFHASRDDIAAALTAFRAAAPRVRRVVAFGNCDAASALVLFGAELDLDGLVLANPWVVEDDADAGHAPAALRRRYRGKLTDPEAWRRLLAGGVDFAKLARGLRRATSPTAKTPLADAMRADLDRFPGSVAILLAKRDRTAALFAAVWNPTDPRLQRLDSASHSFAGAADRAWLLERVLAALRSA